MLLAEIHGKSLEVARDNEDYLTSAVFGHLRYVPPHVFWDDLLRRARGLPGPGGQELSLAEVLAKAGWLPSAFSRVQVHFWQCHETHGEPDLILVFRTDGSPELVVLVEAKLWSDKSGTGDCDQLVRYLRILEDLVAVNIQVSDQAGRYLVYLTPRESLAEVEESAGRVDDPGRDQPRLFRLHWQDMLLAAEKACPASGEPACTILADLARFLRKLGLEYFNGMSQLDELSLLEVGFGGFYKASLTGFHGMPNEPGATTFHGMTREPGLDFFEVCRGPWV